MFPTCSLTPGDPGAVTATMPLAAVKNIAVLALACTLPAPRIASPVQPPPLLSDTLLTIDRDASLTTSKTYQVTTACTLTKASAVNIASYYSLYTYESISCKHSKLLQPVNIASYYSLYTYESISMRSRNIHRRNTFYKVEHVCDRYKLHRRYYERQTFR